ncbi:MAG: hypothetical protein P0Y53_18610 [Candidatus Pseudobacter hemicellulosilyticus]|uniref:Uncharacterized protein n=1 Tax=Candidatus Pseudobacter hemicellulosilyticus TaxID=3121375 RepID=A0AAJ6BG83_9BACT|nr:MAG: hypothetical protein P0Y53_18610 [Pseudobacter sp.]
MNKIVGLLLLLMTLLIVAPSCKKDMKPDDDQPVLPDDATLKEARILLPAGSTYSLKGHEIVTAGSIIPVQEDGKTRVVDAKGKVNIAYLFNQEGKPVMAGFVTDTTATISVETTAEVILYYALGIPFQFDTLTSLYINGRHTIPGLNDWKKEFAASWSGDPRTFLTGSYAPKLRTWLEALSNDEVAVASVGSVNVDANDVRSGLRLQPKGLGLAITNTYRRRTTAFFYKMKRKLEGSQSYETVLPSIGRDTKYGSTLMVDPVAGITSVMGELWKNYSYRGEESAAVTSGPASLELGDKETEAIYRVRVVGPGAMEAANLTYEEEKEFWFLYAKTLAVDFVGPVVGTVVGAFNNYAFFNDDIASIIMVDIPKIVPGFLENCLSGDIKKVAVGMIDALMTEHGYDILVKYVEAMYKGLERPKNLDALIAKGSLILQGIDMALLGGDFVRISHNIQFSRVMEAWDVTVRSSKVSLTPRESAVSIYAPTNTQVIEATIQNLKDEDLKDVSFKWSVQGNFGTLSDSKGNSGTSFTSADKKVTFKSINAAGLTDADNWEYILVTAYHNSQEIGTDTARINVRKARYEIKPSGTTLTGKKDQTHKVNLHLEPVGSGPAIAPNNEYDYKVIWETSGSYGTLAMGLQGNARQITAYDQNNVLYECLDDKVKKATETVDARIYSKKKGASDLEYRLVDYVKGSINIENDEKKKILHVPMTCNHGDTTYGKNSMTCMATSYVSFQGEKDASRYSVRFYDVRWPAMYSWNAGSSQPQKVSEYVARAGEGSFNVAYGSTWSVGTPEQIASRGHNTCSGSVGMAEVIIILK